MKNSTRAKGASTGGLPLQGLSRQELYYMVSRREGVLRISGILSIFSPGNEIHYGCDDDRNPLYRLQYQQ